MIFLYLLKDNIYQFYNEINHNMSHLNTIEVKNKPTGCTVNFSWKDSLAIQHLLDSISSILAEEYIALARQNPDVFLKNEGIK
jgi:hypothetical protein